MKTHHAVFNAIGLVLSGIMLVAFFGQLTTSSHPEYLRRSHTFLAVLMSLEVLISLLLGLGSLTNLSARGLARWPTIAMIIGYCISFWLLPLGIWGVIALTQEQARQKRRHSRHHHHRMIQAT